MFGERRSPGAESFKNFKQSLSLRGAKAFEKAFGATATQDFLSKSVQLFGYRGSVEPEPIAIEDAHTAFPKNCNYISRYLSRYLYKRENLHVQVAKSFVPKLVRRVSGTNETVMYGCNGCVVMCVAGGFSTLTEKLAFRSDGAEVMSLCLNRFFKPLIDITETYRGDIMKFHDDAVLIFFEALNDYRVHKYPCGTQGAKAKTPLQLACLRASACCLEIHHRMHGYDTNVAGVNLSLHIGVGAGRFSLVQVGGGHRLDRYDSFLAGPPMQQLATATAYATSGDIVLSPEAWSEVQFAASEGAPILGDSGGYRRLIGFDTDNYTYPTVKQGAIECAKAIQTEDAEASTESGHSGQYSLQSGDDFRVFMRFIPRAVFKHLRSGNSSSVNEVRSVTVAMILIKDIDTYHAAGSKLAQKLTHNFQKVFYRNEGSLNKLIIDGMSMIFTFAFGLPPLVHTDDPLRAITSCYESVAMLKDIGISGQFGIATGLVFCGVVGSHLRREYMVMGDTTNRAKGLVKLPGSNSIFIDEDTHCRVNQMITSRRLQPMKEDSSGKFMKVFAPEMPVVCGIEVGQCSAVMYHQSWFVRKTRLEVKSAYGYLDTIQFHLPWRASSKLLGGSSPLLQLTRWKELQKVELALRDDAGWLKCGGSLALSGVSGIGKQELSEYLIHQATQGGFLPVFGTMRRRNHEEYRAVVEIVQNCLDILVKIETCANEFDVDTDLRTTLANEAEAINAIMHRLFRSKVHLHPALVQLGYDFFADISKMKVGNTASGSSAVNSTLASHPWTTSAQESADIREAAAAKRELFQLRTFSNLDDADGEDIAMEVAEVALSLVEAVAEKHPVVALLRLRRGTDIKDFLEDGGAVFWELCSTLSAAAMRRRMDIDIGGVQLNPIFVIVVSRKLDGAYLDQATPAYQRLDKRGSNSSLDTMNFWEASKKATNTELTAKDFYDFSSAPDSVQPIPGDSVEASQERTSIPSEGVIAGTVLARSRARSQRNSTPSPKLKSKHHRKNRVSILAETKSSAQSKSSIMEKRSAGSINRATRTSSPGKAKMWSMVTKPFSRASDVLFRPGTTESMESSAENSQHTFLLDGRPTWTLKPLHINMRHLTEDAAVEFMCLCLGLQTVGGGGLVGRRVQEFVSAVSINVPAYIQECLQQLLRENCIQIVGGECISAQNLNSVNIAAWIHTSVVGGAISQLETLGPAKHHIMKLATILQSPFSPFDLVAVNQALFGRLPRFLRFYDQTKLLVSCSELVQMGLLKRVHLSSGSTPADCAPPELPRFTVANFLFRRVTHSRIPKSESLFLKRAILLNRYLHSSIGAKARSGWLGGFGIGAVFQSITTSRSITGMASSRSPRPKGRMLKWVRPWWFYTCKNSNHDSNYAALREDEDLHTYGEGVDPPKMSGTPLFSIRRKATQAACSDHESINLLLAACALGNAAIVRDILEYSGDRIDVNCTDAFGYTPLHFACSSGVKEIVEMLHRLRASVAAKSHAQETPVLIAAQRGHLNVLRFLFASSDGPYLAKDCKLSLWEEQLPDMPTVKHIPTPLVPCFKVASADTVDSFKVASADTVDSFNQKLEKIWNLLRGELQILNAHPLHETAKYSSIRRLALDSTSGLVHSSRSGRFSGKSTSQPSTLKTGTTGETDTRTSRKNTMYAIHNLATWGRSRSSNIIPKTPFFPKVNPMIRNLRKPIRAFLRGHIAMGLMLLCIVLALYLPDVWVAAGMETNTGADIILTVVMIFFSLELVALCVADPSYFGSTFFVTDCIGTVSIAWDISYIFGEQASEPIRLTDKDRGFTFFRALRSGKIGARASRFSRIIKVMRFIMTARRNKEPDGDEKLHEISLQLTNIISTRLACLTVVLMICTPLFSLGLYPYLEHSMRAWVNAMDRRMQVLSQNRSLLEAILHTDMQSMLTGFAQFYVGSEHGPYAFCVGLGYEEQCIESMPFSKPGRGNFQLLIERGEVTGRFDIGVFSRSEAYMNICLITLAIVTMCGACLLLNYFAAELAIRPLIRMMKSIKESANCILGLTGVFSSEDSGALGEFVEHRPEHSGEFSTLERVVQKVAKFAAEAGQLNPAQLAKARELKAEDLGVLEMANRTRNTLKKKGTLRSLGSGGQDFLGDDERLESMSMTQQWRLEEIGFDMEIVDSWNFTPLVVSSAKLVQMAEWLIVNNPGSFKHVDRHLETKTIRSFVNQVFEGYAPNPYHNFMHAADVTHSVFRMGTLMQLERVISESNQFAVLVAALGHDVGHFGLNNSFLILTEHELAIRYNDNSPLENMHCCKLFSLLSMDECTIFQHLESSQYKSARTLVIEAILHTDMSHHPGMLKELQLLYEMHSQVFNAGSDKKLTDQQVEILKTPDNKKLVTKFMLHGADMLNPAKPWDIAFDWTHRVLDEYFAQGDKEKELGLPVQMLNDRVKVNKPNSQIGFIEFIVAPYLAAELRIIKSWFELAVHLQSNLLTWEELWVDESKPDSEEKDKMESRVQKVKQTLDFAFHSRKALARNSSSTSWNLASPRGSEPMRPGRKPAPSPRGSEVPRSGRKSGARGSQAHQGAKHQ